MHKIDRYGVIALVFMAVTFLVVYLWDDRGKAAPKKETKKGTEIAKLEPRPGKPSAPAHTKAPAREESPLPLSQGATRTNSPSPTPGRVPEAESNEQVQSVPRPLPAAEEGDSAPDRRAVERPADQPAGRAEREPAPRERESTVRAAQAQPEERRPVAPAESRSPSQATKPPKPANPSPAAPKLASRTYTVAAGDTFDRIAARELGDKSRWTEIQALNGGLDPRKLWVGKELLLPADARAQGALPATAKASKPAAEKESAPPTDSRAYVIQKGDILGRIAQRELGTVKDIPRILSLNPKLDPDHLVAGTTIYLPGGKPTKSQTPAREELVGTSSKVAQADTKSTGKHRVR